jgi:hypothetical protein
MDLAVGHIVSTGTPGPIKLYKNYCQETGKKFYDWSGGQLKDVISTALRRGEFEKEEAVRYLGMLKAPVS